MTRENNLRISDVDIVRGLVMLVMVLDHTRDWFGDHTISALDVDHTSGALFFSRWITHFCAPSFVFLAGVGVFIQHERTGTPSLSRYLLVRGLLLIILEQTFLRCFGWYFNFDYRFMNANVLWGIGGAMILMSVCVYLPRLAVMVLGLSVIIFHDLLLQAIHVSETDSGNWLWVMLLRGGNIEYIQNHNLFISYPIVPWFGIMAFGFGLGKIIASGSSGNYGLRVLAFLFVSTFVVLRGLFSFGDPASWQRQETIFRSFLSFINLEKYPPSFLFTLMTLSITLFLLTICHAFPGHVRNFLQRFGRTALFFYVAHIMVIHALAVAIGYVRFGRAEWLYEGPGIFWDETLPGHPEGYGLSLPWVYGIAILVIAVLYPCCIWYSELKRSGRIRWLKYF
jgi:uncharacterized membrane protein